LFFFLFVAQFCLLRPNGEGSRFAVVQFAAFALLWAATAEKFPLVVSFGVVAALLIGSRSLYEGGPPLLVPRYTSDHERFNALPGFVGANTLLLLARGMSNDAEIAGRLARTRFEYVSCPLDGDWKRQIEAMKRQSPWFLFSVNEPSVTPGPHYTSRLGPPCPALRIADLKGWLKESGWRHVFSVVAHELWTAVPDLRNH
jgi:hypothetical protein